jgi:hypothetical protein
MVARRPLCLRRERVIALDRQRNRPRSPFKLLTGLCLSCSLKFLSSGQHAYSNHRDEAAAITVKLFDQTLLADVEMLCIKETVFGVRDGAPLMDHTHPCLVALAAALHWPLHMHWQ